MKIEKVSLSRTIPTGAYMNDKIGMEATVEAGDIPERVLGELLLKIDQWHRSANPHLYQEEKTFTKVYEGGTIGNPNLTPPIIQRQEDFPEPDALSGILAASTLNELKTYKIVASADKTLYNAYNQRLKELTQ